MAHWLSNIRRYFPSTVVQVMQKDALDRLRLERMLCELEMLEAVEADVLLIATMLSPNRIMPDKTRSTARAGVNQVVRELENKLPPLLEAVTGSPAGQHATARPRHHEIDWPSTIRANLKHYQPDYQTIVPETRISFLRDIVLCIN